MSAPTLSTTHALLGPDDELWAVAQIGAAMPAGTGLYGADRHDAVILSVEAHATTMRELSMGGSQLADAAPRPLLVVPLTLAAELVAVVLNAVECHECATGETAPGAYFSARIDDARRALRAQHVETCTRRPFAGPDDEPAMCAPVENIGQADADEAPGADEAPPAEAAPCVPFVFTADEQHADRDEADERAEDARDTADQDEVPMGELGVFGTMIRDHGDLTAEGAPTP